MFIVFNRQKIFSYLVATSLNLHSVSVRYISSSCFLFCATSFLSDNIFFVSFATCSPIFIISTLFPIFFPSGIPLAAPVSAVLPALPVFHPPE